MGNFPHPATTLERKVFFKKKLCFLSCPIILAWRDNFLKNRFRQILLEVASSRPFSFSSPSPFQRGFSGLSIVEGRRHTTPGKLTLRGGKEGHFLFSPFQLFSRIPPFLFFVQLSLLPTSSPGQLLASCLANLIWRAGGQRLDCNEELVCYDAYEFCH